MPINAHHKNTAPPFLLRKWKEWPSWNRWLIGTVGFFLILLTVSPDQNPVAQTPEQARAQVIDQLFSDKNGSNAHLTNIVLVGLHDPDSYEHKRTTYMDMGDHLIVSTNYTANNMFGKKVSGFTTARLGLDGKVISVIERR